MRSNYTAISIRGWLIWFLCALFFLYEFLLRTILGTFQIPLSHQLQLSPVEFALVSGTVYQVVYSLMQIPVGFISYRYGLRKSLLLAITVCALANLGFSLVQNFPTALLLRALMGLGSSFGFICLLVAVYDWFPRKNCAFMIGLSQFIGTLGPMLAAGPVNALEANGLITWREMFLLLSIVGALLAIAVVILIHNRQDTRNDYYILTPRPASLTSAFSHLLRQPQIWWIGFYSSSVYFALEYLSANEGISFLTMKGFDSVFSAYLITLAWLGYAIGCPVIGYLSDRLQKRKPLMLACSLLIIINLVLIIFVPAPPAAMILCFILLGIGASGQSLGFAIISEHCDSRYLAVGLAFNNTLIMTVGAFNAPMTGYLLSTTSGAPTLILYQHAFTLMLMLAVPSVLLVLFFIKETFCKPVHSLTQLIRGTNK